jgi:Flp pilus assembly CpaE family ATPase
MLVISPDNQHHQKFSALLSPENFSVTSQCETLTGMNGTAARMAAVHDVIVFEWDNSDPQSLSAVQDMCKARGGTSRLIALAQEDLPLSVARELNKAGVDEVLPRHALEEEVIPSILSWRDRRNASLPILWGGYGTEGKLIVVAQARGGIGATTLAVNLADQLRRSGASGRKATPKNVAIVDLDFQFGTIAAMLDVDESEALWRMAMDGTHPDAAFVDQAIVKSAGGLSVLTAPPRYGPLTALTSTQIAAIIDALKQTHDYVVIDLPRALVDWIEPVLAKSDRLLLATDITVPSVRAARKLLDFYMSEHPGLNVDIIATREKKPMFAAAHHKAAARLLQMPLQYWIPDDPKPAREALDRGKPLGEVASGSKIAKSIRSIAAGISSALPARQAHV